ncbi:MAG: FUSC family protein, partial [Acidimicrobiales bacterium]
FLADTPGQHGTPTRGHRAEMYLMQGSERMEDALATLISTGSAPDLGDPLTRDELTLVRQLSAALAACTRSLDSGAALPQIGSLHETMVAFRSASETAFVSSLAESCDIERFAVRVERAFVLRELAEAVLLAVVNTRIAQGGDPGVEGADMGPVVEASLKGSRTSTLSKCIRRTRANLTLDSVHLRNSLRLAGGLALARFIVGLLGLQHGFWVVFATLTVLKTTATGTRTTALRALLGTAIGFGGSAVLVLTTGTRVTVLAILLPIVTFLSTYLSSVNFVGGQAFFTLLVVVLFNLLDPAGWSLGAVRLEDVAVGATVGVLIGVAAWPKGAGGVLRDALGDVLDSTATYVTRTAERLLPGRALSPAPDMERSQGFASGLR